MLPLYCIGSCLTGLPVFVSDLQGVERTVLGETGAVSPDIVRPLVTTHHIIHKDSLRFKLS